MAEYKLSNYATKNFLEIKNTLDSTNSHTIVNDLKRDVVIVVSMNAGSGDFNGNLRWHKNTPWDDRQKVDEYYSIAGKQGTTINLNKDSKLISIANGGSGNLEFYAVGHKLERDQYRDNSGNIKGYGEWRVTQHYIYRNDRYNIKREGQQDFKILIFNAGSTLKIDFIDNGARNVFKGSIALSFGKRENVLGYHTIKG